MLHLVFLIAAIVFMFMDAFNFTFAEIKMFSFSLAFFLLSLAV